MKRDECLLRRQRFPWAVSLFPTHVVVVEKLRILGPRKTVVPLGDIAIVQVEDPIGLKIITIHGLVRQLPIGRQAKMIRYAILEAKGKLFREQLEGHAQ